jgi:ABC-2 type transport system ATP-binding protein
VIGAGWLTVADLPPSSLASLTGAALPGSPGPDLLPFRHSGSARAPGSAETGGRNASARIGEALDRVGLLGAARKRYRHYSLGMKQRLAIAASLLRPRDLLVLDEPTNGLDPQGTREVRAVIRQIAAGGTTVFMSSHLLAEVEQVCSHVGVMRTGRLVFQGPLAQLRAAGPALIRVETADPAAAAAVLKRIGLSDPRVTGDEVTARLAADQPERICAELVGAGVGIRGFGVAVPNLEELFVELTGEGFGIDA